MMRFVKTDASGKALIELAMILPFLFLITYGTLEALKYCRYEQFLSVVSREVGRASFDCAYNSPDTVSDCVKRAVETAFPTDSPGIVGITGLMQNSGVIVSVWQHNPGAGPTLVGRHIRDFTVNGALKGLNAGDSHFNAARVAALHSYTAEKGRIVTAEAFYEFPPLLPVFGGNYYSVTIL